MKQSKSVEIHKLSEVQNLPVAQQEVTLADLLKLAEPLVSMWTKNDNEKHQRELEYANNVLQAVSKQNRLMTIGLFVLLALVFVVAGILFYLGRDTTAMAVIQLVVGLGGAVLGGYGWAMGKRRTEREQEE